MQTKRISRRIAAVILLAATVLVSGCATHYLDKGTPEVPSSQFNKPSSAQAAQLIFEFQTNGAPNAGATKYLKEQVVTQVKESGLFSELSDPPAPSQALLTLTLNNLANMDEAMSKGFLTGLTFGAKGSMVTDGYLCTVKYLPPSAKEPITKTAKHAIYTSMGSDSGTGQGIKVASIEEGVRTMVRQIVSQALNSLSLDPDFK